VGGFGVSQHEDLLLITDLVLIRQQCSDVSVKFDDTAVADYFDEQVDQGRLPAEFARVWVHTHPGNSPLPSRTDEETFERCFGSADWALMFILARGGECYARLRLGSVPGGEVVLPVEVDFSQPFDASAWERWEAEYRRAVSCEELLACVKAVDKPIKSSFPSALHTTDPSLDPTFEPFLESAYERW
jgi:proteasome lid subunit RPN8/RPN11